MRNKGRTCFKDKWITALMMVVFLAVFAFTQPLLAQETSPSITFNPRGYICYQSLTSLDIDGKLDEKSWQKAEWSAYFVDIEGKDAPRPRFKTRVKMLWDEQYFYIAARLDEPHLWGTMTKRDAVLFHENNFEVFIDPNGDTHQYYELEVNALGTFWDLMLPKPYRDGGRAVDAWDIRGLKIGIDLEGTLNDPSDQDSGWTVELALPWEVLEEAAPEGRPPANGEVWRVNFSRVQWKIQPKNGEYVKQSNNEDNWVWSPQGIVNMHYPEMWGYVQFVNDTGGRLDTNPDALGKSLEEQLKWYLRILYYRQHTYRQKHKTYTERLPNLEEKKVRNQVAPHVDFAKWSDPEVHATDHTFEIFLEHRKTGKRWYIREDGRVWQR